jgi:site-specific recombinase XerD
MAQNLQVVAPRGVARNFDAAAMVTDWEADLWQRVEAGELAATTATTYTRGMARFLAWLQEHEHGRLGAGVVRAWKADLARDGHKPAGINTFYAGVRRFFKWAVSERSLAYDPTAGVEGASRRGATRKHKREALSDGEVLRVLAQPDTASIEGRRDLAMLMLMAYTGARSVEVQRATIGDIRTDGKLKLMVHGKGHGEADEELYLVHPDLVDALYNWLAVHPHGGDLQAPIFCGLGNRNQGGALSMRTIRKLVKGYYLQAGIRDPRKTTHSLRHSLVTNLIRHGVNPTKIMTVTRHKSLDTLLAYAHEVERDSDPAEGYVDYSGG